MKTNLVKAAVVLVLMLTTLSVNAQNTKSLKENRLADKISNLVKTTISNSSQELAEELNTLKEIVQYTPEEIVEYSNEPMEPNYFDLSELELIIKFKPTCFEENDQYTNEVFTETLKELEQYSRYKPADLDFDNLTFAEIENELASTVKYSPAS